MGIGVGIGSNLIGPGAMVSPQPGVQIPVMILVDQNGNFVPSATGTSTTQVSLNAVTSNTNGSVVDLGFAYSRFSFVVTTTGAPTGGTVTLSVSVDGSTFVASSATVTVGSNPALGNLANVAVRWVRLDLTGLTGGSSPTVTAKIMAS